MGEEENRDAVVRYFAAVNGRDFQTMDQVRHDDDFVQEWPQMRARSRGKDRTRAMDESDPAPLKSLVRRIAGAGDAWIAETGLAHPDGRMWEAVTLFEFRDGKVVRQTEYLAPPIDAPPWRAQWLERM
ncbi:MAG TPA: nuclear transport factor 2 family protein [Actinomycetota bacterium]|nr:nuclear transport factor 2 family protein [Actinomycetota bacterium]